MSQEDEASKWTEHQKSDGRVYWSHSVTKQSVWEKPDDLKTPFEQAMNKTPWKVYSSKGRVYYVHSGTKETKWDLPQELIELKRKIDEDEKEKKEQEAAAAARLLRGPSAEPEPTSQALALRSPSPPPTPRTPRSPSPLVPMSGFSTFQEAEHAFIHLLKKAGVDETWTWDVTMRKIITDPLYKSLSTLGEKKEAWAKYTTGRVKARQETRQLHISKLKPRIERLLNAHPRMRSYSTFRTAEEIFKNDKTWNELEVEERGKIFDEWVRALRNAEESSAKALLERNISIMTALVRSLEFTVSTPYREALHTIQSSSSFVSDPSLQTIHEVEIIRIFEEYSDGLWKEHEERSKREGTLRARKGRKARDAFRTLLSEMENRGEVTPTSKWKDTVLFLEKEPAFIDLCGLPGSTPLDLWMDAVDDLSENVALSVEKIRGTARKEGKDEELKTLVQDGDRDGFEALVKDLGLGASLEEKKGKAAWVFDSIKSQLDKVAADEKKKTEKKRKQKIDDLRYAMKGSKVVINLDGTYEEAIPILQELAEFKDEELDEESKKEAFEKFVVRQKEKLSAMEVDEGSATGSQRDRERKRPSRPDEGRSTSPRVKEEDGEDSKSRRERDKERDRERDRRARDKERDRERDRGKDKDRRRADRDDKDRERERDRDRDRDRGDRHRSSRDKYRDERDDDRDRRRGEEKTSRSDADREKTRKSRGDEGKDSEAEEGERAAKKPRIAGASDVDVKMEAGSEEGEI